MYWLRPGSVHLEPKRPVARGWGAGAVRVLARRGNRRMSGNEFHCPYCDRSRVFRTAIGGLFGVCWHFFVRHGHKSFRVGCPLFDDEPPEPEEFDP